MEIGLKDFSWNLLTQGSFFFEASFQKRHDSRDSVQCSLVNEGDDYEELSSG